MSRSIGIASTTFSGVRVAGQLTFIPAHTRNGNKVNAKVLIPVYKNSNRGTNQKTGEKGRTDSYKLVAWGKLAERCCKSLAPGKALDCICDPQSYLGNLFNADGSARVDSSGQPIQVTRTSFTILNLVFGEDSNKRIAQEIQEGRRPAYWNVPSHTDWALWSQMLTDKQALTWDGQSQLFGYARVVIPSGAGVALDFSQPAEPGQNMQQFAAGTLPAAPLPNQVANVVGPAPVYNQVPAAPIPGVPAAPMPQSAYPPGYNQVPAAPMPAAPQPVPAVPVYNQTAPAMPVTQAALF